MAGSSCDGFSSPSAVVWFTLCAESRVGWSSPPCHVYGGGCASGTYQVVYRPAFWIRYLASGCLSPSHALYTDRAPAGRRAPFPGRHARLLCRAKPDQARRDRRSANVRAQAVSGAAGKAGSHFRHHGDVPRDEGSIGTTGANTVRAITRRNAVTDILPGATLAVAGFATIWGIAPRAADAAQTATVRPHRHMRSRHRRWGCWWPRGHRW